MEDLTLFQNRGMFRLQFGDLDNPGAVFYFTGAGANNQVIPQNLDTSNQAQIWVVRTRLISPQQVYIVTFENLQFKNLFLGYQNPNAANQTPILVSRGLTTTASSNFYLVNFRTDQMIFPTNSGGYYNTFQDLPSPGGDTPSETNFIPTSFTIIQTPQVDPTDPADPTVDNSSHINVNCTQNVNINANRR